MRRTLAEYRYRLPVGADSEEQVTSPVSKANAPHYAWGGDCDGWRLVDRTDLSVIHERMPAGRHEIRHWHAKSLQFFFVLGGTLTLAVDGIRHQLDAGQGLEIAPNLGHQALNDSSGPVEFLVISQPTTSGDRQTV